jgi:hypothetical protein
MKSIKISIIFIALSLTLSMQSCTNLDETVYSSIPADQFYNNEAEMITNVGRAYTHFKGMLQHYGLWSTDLISSDEAVCPYRETNLWWDNGVWINLHKQNYSPLFGNTQESWRFIFNGVTTCNQVIYQMEQSKVDFPTKDKLKSEVKVLRAYLYYLALDRFGNVPLATDFGSQEIPEQVNRVTLFAFIEKELKDNVDALDANPTSANYGRVTQSMVYTTLAKMYLNALEWIGTAKWQEASDACDKVLTPVKYTLSTDYFANFKVSNTSSKENIFVIPFDDVYNEGGYYNTMLFHQLTLHTLSQQTFNIQDFCWDGFCATEKQWNLYEATDLRRKGWLEGPQYSMTGAPLMIGTGRQLNYRPAVGALYSEANPAKLDDGVRFAKYEYKNGLYKGMSNDFVVYRLADVLLMKTEALVRLSRASDALQYINQVRKRAGVSEYTSASQLTLQEILDERGRELAWEGDRRQDLIRFGKWNEAWQDKPATAAFTKLYPIPYWAMDTNPNLVQNPGY